MNNEELARLANGWVAYRHDPKNEATWSEWSRSDQHLSELIEDWPLAAWRLILAILDLDQSMAVMQTLSAGPLEDLLWKHGPLMIEAIETQARTDPSFARLLGGVWQNNMTEEIWARVQAVWDRRGWDGIPEA